MALRWQFERDTRFNIPVKVEIYDTEFSGSVTTLEYVGNKPVNVTMGTMNSDPLEKIRGSFIDLRLRGAEDDFTDLFDRNNDRFLIKLYVDGALDSEFIPIPDTFQDFVTGGDYELQIQGANLSLLKQVDAWEALGVAESEQDTRLGVIRKLINHYFNLGIVDGTVIKPTQNTDGASGLVRTFVKLSRIEGMTAYQALEQLIPKGHQLRITRGKAFIIPVTESSFVGYEFDSTGSFVSSATYNDNFTAVFKGGRLGTTRKKLPVYDGVRRIYDPLEGENAVPSGSFNLEDFGLTEISGTEVTVTVPNGWTIENYPDTSQTRLITTSVGSSRYAWSIPETVGTLDQSIAFGRPPAQFRVESKDVLQGQRLLVRLTVEYDSINEFAYVPIHVQVGDKTLVRQLRQTSSFNLPSIQANWTDSATASTGYEVGISPSGYVDIEFLTPPIPETGVMKFGIDTPTVDRQYNGGSHWLNISEFSVDVADEDGEVQRKSELLAGSKGQVYEYTEGFGDGFSEMNAGSLRRTEAGNLNGLLTDTWFYVDLPDTTGTLAQIETKYLYSQLSRDLDRLQGTADVYDYIALIEGKRVNYISTDFRYGNSKIELVEIEAHNLDATVEDRRERGNGTFSGGGGSPRPVRPPIDQSNAIGIITETIEEEQRTSIDVELDLPVRVGIEYWIVNESELSRTDRFAGIYPFIPSGTAGAEFGPGEITLSVEEQLFNVPEGSFIFKSPDQSEVDDNVFQDRIDDAQANLDNLNNVELPALEADLEELNTVTLPNLRSDLDDAQTQLDAVLPITETKISDDAISTPKLQTNAVTAGKIVAEAITAIKISAGAVIAEKIATDAVTTNKIQAGAITTVKIGANQVTANKIDVDDLAANTAFIEALFAEQITIQTGGYIQSDGFTSGSSGFRINSNGDAEFNDVEIRGDFLGGTIENLDITGELTISDSFGKITFDAGAFGLASLERNSWEIVASPSLITGGIEVDGAIRLNQTYFNRSLSSLPSGDPSRIGQIYRKSGSLIGSGDDVLCVSAG